MSKSHSAVYKLDIPLDLNVDLHKFLGISTTPVHFDYLRYIMPAPVDPNNLILKQQFDDFKKQYLETFKYNQALPGFQQQNWLRCRDSVRKLFAAFCDEHQNYILQMLSLSYPFANTSQVQSLSSVSKPPQANSSEISIPPSVSASILNKSTVSTPAAPSIVDSVASIPPSIINLVPPELPSIPPSVAPPPTPSSVLSDFAPKPTTSSNPMSDVAFAHQIESIINSNSMPSIAHNQLQSQRAGMVKTPLLNSAVPELRYPIPADTSLGGNLSEANYNEINASLQQYGRQLDPFKPQQAVPILLVVIVKSFRSYLFFICFLLHSLLNKLIFIYFYLFL